MFMKLSSNPLNHKNQQNKNIFFEKNYCKNKENVS